MCNFISKYTCLYDIIIHCLCFFVNCKVECWKCFLFAICVKPYDIFAIANEGTHCVALGYNISHTNEVSVYRIWYHQIYRVLLCKTYRHHCAFATRKYHSVKDRISLYASLAKRGGPTRSATERWWRVLAPKGAYNKIIYIVRY